MPFMNRRFFISFRNAGGLAPVLAALLFFGAFSAPFHAARASTLRFEVPVRCDMRADCFIQQYFDHDPGPDYRDYACGRLAYDGHTGTDFRVRDLVQMRRGVAVLAAAAGRVRAVRDGMDDVDVNDIGLKALQGRYAGNSVVLTHPGGVETQYSHLRKGSVRVRPGDMVELGQELGLVGLSGRTEFPHLEFAVRVGGRNVDPFRGLSGGPECGPGDAPLWSEAALAALPYEPTRLLAAGFASRPPSVQEVARRKHDTTVFASRARALVYWVRVAGLLTGDVLQFSLTAPDGTVLARHEQLIEHSKAQFFQYVGKRRGDGPWPEGSYRGRFTLLRPSVTGLTPVLEQASTARVSH